MLIVFISKVVKNKNKTDIKIYKIDLSFIIIKKI